MLYPPDHQSWLFVDTDLCHNCGHCLALKVCTRKALMRIDRDEPPFVDVHRCYNCRECVSACPFTAIRTL